MDERTTYFNKKGTDMLDIGLNNSKCRHALLNKTETKQETVNNLISILLHLSQIDSRISLYRGIKKFYTLP